MNEPSFVHLRTRSDYSIVDGLAKVESLVARAHREAMPAVALTDFSNVCGWVKFSQAAKKHGIKPVVGVDLLCSAITVDANYYPMTLLAKNALGYRELLLLLSRSHLRGHVSGMPCIEFAWLLEPPCKNWVILSGGMQGELGCALRRQDNAACDAILQAYQLHFPREVYLEIQRLGYAGEEEYTEGAVQLARKHRLPILATNPVRFLDAEDFDAHHVRVAIYEGLAFSALIAAPRYSMQHYFRSAEEMCALFADLPEALANSVELAKRCTVDLILGQHYLPHIETGAETPDAYLARVAEEGLAVRLRENFSDEATRANHAVSYGERLRHEVQVIQTMGFSSYFLVVMDFVGWAQTHQIPVGPGRGSGAGSLVAYVLRITDIDPIRFGLLFERLLNPGRISLPDFDIDFCMEKRDRVIEYVVDRYGRDAVAQIITFGAMAARAAIRDVGRVLGHPYGFVDKIAKLVPFDVGITLQQALETSPQLKEKYDSDEEVKALIQMAQRLEGVVRNAGKHAGGLVIAPTKLTNFSALYCDAQGENPVTQFDKNDIEAVGLVKFDFLGLRTLTIIHWALAHVNLYRVRDQLPPLVLNQLPLDDPLSFALLNRAETTAVFQLEGRGMRELIMRQKPDSFEELIALLALIRPGPTQSGMVDNFIDRKHGREVVSYPDRHYQHPLLEPILKETYGVILYQEQAMQIAQVLAGYSLQDADLLRRAIGKKKPKEMQAHRVRFGDGAERNGIDRELAMKIFDLVEKFSGYGFNKSHSAAYAILTYQTLWLKAHYPLEFMAAVLTSELDNTEKLLPLLEEVHRLGIKLCAPDINRSEYGFSLSEARELLYGLGAIKGVGRSAVEAVIEARQSHGAFQSLGGLCLSLDPKRVTKSTLEKLIYSGACDSLADSRRQLIEQLPTAIKLAERHRSDGLSGQSDLFGCGRLRDAEVSGGMPCAGLAASAPSPLSLKELELAQEYEVLGFYLSGHPMDSYRDEFSSYPMTSMDHWDRYAEQGATVTVAGIVVSTRTVKSQRGLAGLLIVLDTGKRHIEALCLPEVLRVSEEILQKTQRVVLEGTARKDLYTQRDRLRVKKACSIPVFRMQYLKAIRISVAASTAVREEALGIHFKRLLMEAQVAAQTPLLVEYRTSQGHVMVNLGQYGRVFVSDALVWGLKDLFGEMALTFSYVSQPASRQVKGA